MSIQARQFLLPAALASVAISSFSCSKQIVSFKRDGLSSLSGLVMSWKSPRPIDMAFESSGLLQFDPAALKSFSDFRLGGSGSQLGLVGGFYFGAQYRTTGRLYFPYTQFGTGWAPAGSSHDFLDTGSLSPTNIAVGTFGSGILSVFTDGNSALSSVFNGTGWVGDTTSVSTQVPSGSPGSNGSTMSIAGDGSGYGYLGYIDINSAAYVQSYAPGAGWNPGTPGIALGNGARQIETLSDQSGTHVFWLGDSRTTAGPCTSCELRTAAQSSNFSAVSTIGTLDVKTFSVAADANQNLVAAFIKQNPGAPACSPSTNPPTMNCQYRVYAAVKTTGSDWASPTQLDSDFAQDATSTYQSSFGIEYFKPAVTYLGSGKFMVVFAMTDNASRMTGLYYRLYREGPGWDPKLYTIEQASIAASSEQFRFANDLRIASNGRGLATLVVHSVDPDSSPSIAFSTTRNYGFKVFHYDDSLGWDGGRMLSSTPTCDVSIANPQTCWTMKAAVHVFPSGESVVVYPGPDPSLRDYLRLYSVEYRP